MSRTWAETILVFACLSLVQARPEAQFGRFLGRTPPEDFGRFEGEVVARWNDDGRTMTLVQPFAFLDVSKDRWDAPEGSVVDGASIPRIAWSFIGGPFEGLYRAASVIHDVACVEKRKSWQSVHLAFYAAMRAAGVPVVKSKIMYAAVYHFGPRWPQQMMVRECSTVDGQQQCVDVERLVDPPSPTLREDQFQRLAELIERGERPRLPLGMTGSRPLSLDEIEAYIGR